MNRVDIRHIVRSILAEDFNTVATPEMCNNTLESLNDNFKFLVFLLKLEELLQLRFNKKILLVENISATIHTPEDIANLIFETLQEGKKM